VGEYIPTTSTINSAPRFDHNPTTGESLGLLVEEQRVNLALQSEDFSTSWGSSNYVVTTNATAAPNGTATADKVVRNTTDAVAAINLSATVTVSTAYNFSCFVKAAELSKIGLREGASTGNFVTFDLTTASIISSSSGATGAITPYPNGWYRISMQMTTGGAQTSYGMRIVPLRDDYVSGTPSYSFAGDGTSGLFIWGAQLEAGAFPTSYIPTTTATVTRSADVASISGSNFSSWYRQDEGTIFANALSLRPVGDTTRVIALSDGTANNSIRLNVGTQFIVTGGTNEAAYTSLPTNNNGFNFTAIAYKLNDANAASNGTIGTPDTSVLLPTVNQLEIGRLADGASGSRLVGTIRRLVFWPRRLGNEVLQSITQ
jgi:hypothetical protein